MSCFYGVVAGLFPKILLTFNLKVFKLISLLLPLLQQLKAGQQVVFLVRLGINHLRLGVFLTDLI